MHEGISLRLSTKVWGGNWSGAQLRRGTMNAPGHGNEDDEDDNDDDDDVLMMINCWSSTK